MTSYRGSLARHTGQRTSASLRPCVPWQGRHGYARRSKPPRKRNATAGRRGETLAAFACGNATQKRPRRERRAEAACVGTPAGWGRGGTGLRQPRVLALGYEVGRPPLAAISLGLRRTLRFGLRVADSLGQHLAQLSIRLRRLALGFLPLGHGQYVGTPQGEVNPCWSCPRAQGCGTLVMGLGTLPAF
jgi:hypothetical protein